MGIITDPVVIVVTALVFPPLVTLLHELAHAVVALATQPGRVRVQCGFGERFRWTARLGRLHLEFRGPWFALGRCDFLDGPPSSPLRWMLVSAAGPTLSVALFVGAGYTVRRVGGDVGMWVSPLVTFALLSFVMTAIPMTYTAAFGGLAGHRSDGALIAQLWRAARADGGPQTGQR